MIIRSIRIKNIKSYGEGAEANGITVNFQRGVNRVAGRNGHGKSTLIEALGYALFSSEPEHEEKFYLPAYFLRAGEKQGEIDVVFEHGGKGYRVERGLGQSKRRSKVVDLSDESTCAMDDAEVSAYLCRLLGFKDQDQMEKLFSNLIGVKQGRLTRPFDSKPAQAKEFFEPLLDVAIFRESTSRLAEAHARFKEFLQEQNNKLAAIAERIRLLAGSGEKVAIKEAEIESLSRVVEKSRKQKEETEKLKQSWELKQKAFDSARNMLEDAKSQLRLAIQKRESDQLRFNESLEAVSIVKRTEPGYKAYIAAEARLRALHQHQKEKSSLEKQRSEAGNARIQWEAKKIGAQKQAQDYRAQREEKMSQSEVLRRQLEARKQFEDTKAEFEKLAGMTAHAKHSREALGAWIEGLPGYLEESSRLLADILLRWEKIQAWDAKGFLQAKADEQRLEQVARELGTKLAKAEEAKETLERQLGQINGGVCPFLKTQCRQFDPKAVQSDIGAQDKEILAIRKHVKESVKGYERAKVLAEKLSKQESELSHLRSSLEERVRAFVGRYNEIFPATIRKHLAVIYSYLPAHLIPPQPLDCPVVDSLWPGAAATLETVRLRELADGGEEFFKRASHLLQQISPILEDRLRNAETQQGERVRKERDLEHAKKNFDQLELELKACSKRIEELNAEGIKADGQANVAAVRVSELDGKLKAFANLELESREQHEIQDKNAQNQQAYLGARPLADKTGERLEVLKKSAALEQEAIQQVQKKTEGFDLTNREFDAAALERCREAAQQAELKLAMKLHEFKEAESDLKQEKERFKQWKEAGIERDGIESEMRRLQAAGNLSKMAGKVLKDAAPVVAQHLCSRIAFGAQRIFNQINPEPMELEWKAEPQYSLRITPGDRRFAMLSGGEQTKLALAMTLAMIEQFSNLRFAVFDEPTYGVDAESRQKLADAIIDAQRAAGLDQLILVSHDNVFEGKIEHVVVLNKTAALGTELVAMA